MKKESKYVEGVGRRKTATARVRLVRGTAAAIVNNRSLDEYFRVPFLKEIALAPIRDAKVTEKFAVSVRVVGGGLQAQAEAVRHGLARALAAFDPELKKKLRTLGYLTRDPRMVERKKYGLKKARRAPQWQKR